MKRLSRWRGKTRTVIGCKVSCIFMMFPTLSFVVCALVLHFRIPISCSKQGETIANLETWKKKTFYKNVTKGKLLNFYLNSVLRPERQINPLVSSRVLLRYHQNGVHCRQRFRLIKKKQASIVLKHVDQV